MAKIKKTTAGKPKARGGLAAAAAARLASGDGSVTEGKAQIKARKKAEKAQAKADKKTAKAAAKAAKSNGSNGDKPPGEGRMNKIMGHSVCSILHLLGKKKVSTARSTAILAANGITGMPPKSLYVHLNLGKNGVRAAAALTDEQYEELLASAPEPVTESPVAKAA